MSDGIIHDFAGPYFVEVDNLSFGETHKYDFTLFWGRIILNFCVCFRYVALDVAETERWDQSVIKADRIYEKMMHNICW
jgi:hypothetical protein